MPSDSCVLAGVEQHVEHLHGEQVSLLHAREEEVRARRF